MKYLLVLPLLLLLSCGENNLPKYSTLSGLRILALVVDTPELQNPGAGTVNVNLTPYVSDLNGSGNITLEIQSCLDPGVALGAEGSCTNATNASSVQTVTVTAAAAQPTGTFGSPERTGKPSTGTIAVGLQIPANFLDAYSSALQFNGVAYLITVKATASTGVVKSFRRVLISKQTPNTNPTLSDILANGSTLSSLPTTDVELSFSNTPTTGSYQLMSSTGEVQAVAKVYQTTWFVTDGEVLNPRSLATETTTWSTPTAPTGRKTVVVGVLRDGRGGTSVLVKAF